MSITIAIIVVTVLISFRAFNDPALKAKLLFHPVTVKNRGEYYRFITSGFVHADFNHLLFNMWALYIFGETAEAIFAQLIFPNPMVGRLMFVLFYLAAIAASSQVTFYRHQDNYGYSALGASGGVSAMMWPYIMYDPWNWFMIPPLPAFILGVGYLWYSHYMDQRGNSRIGHNAHLWGAIFGLLVYLILLFFRLPGLLEQFWILLQQPRGPSFLGG